MRSAKAKSVGLMVLACLAFLLAGCASEREFSPAPRLQDPLVGREGAAALFPVAEFASVDASGSLLIRYRHEGAAVLLGGRLDTSMPEGGAGEQDVHSLPPVLALTRLDTDVDVDTKEVTPIEIRPVEDWVALLRHLATEAAGLVPGQGVVLDILREQELFLYLDEEGGLHASLLANKPAGIEPALALGLDELLLDGLERIRGDAPGMDMLLFNTGDPAYPFVVLSLTQARVWFLRHVAANAQPLGMHATAHTVQAAYHALTSQARGLTTQPVSTLGRFLGGVTTAVVDTLPAPGLAPLDPSEPPPPLAVAAEPMDLATWEQELDVMVPGSETFGRIRYLVDGDRFFPALVHAIGDAKEAIRIRLYIFDNDDYAVNIADLLKGRSREIPVEILLDGLGTISGGMAQAEFTPEHAQPGPLSIAAYLRADSNVRVRVLPNPWMQGDHTKALLFDDRVAFLGGMNIGREYRYEWHDLMAALEGPVVDRLVEDFDKAWKRAGLLGEFRQVLQVGDQVERSPAPGDYPLRLLYTRTGDYQILRSQVAALRKARQRVWIQNAYLTSDRVLYEMIAARRRGVDVRVILPYRTDAGFIGRSNVLAANLLLRNGVRVYIFPGMSHVKAAVYDGWACFGSANFDRLSLRLNRETNIATSHPDAVQGLVDEVFNRDFARALELREELPASWLDYLHELVADQL